MTVTGTRDTSGGHVLRVTLHYESVLLAVECREPEGAVCRVTCAAGVCETYEYPDHEHGLRPAPYCHAEEYFDNGDVECSRASNVEIPLHDGMSITVAWNGDGYEWSPAEVLASAVKG